MKKIIADFIIDTPNGFYCRIGGFYLDPKTPVQNAVISHAHADHAIAGSVNVYAHPATFDFMKLRYKQRAAKQFIPIEFHQSFFINQIKIVFIPAGHMLGSAQILMEFEGLKYLYSGDVKSQADTTCEAIEFIQADVLITETTFANPSVKHPSPLEAMQSVLSIERPLLIGAYVLGKAQRITALINEIAPSAVVAIHHDILAYHQIYERYQRLTKQYQVLEKKDLRLKKPYIYIVPPLTFNTYKLQGLMSCVFASGWQALQQANTHTLLLSDHMDWFDLLDYIEQVKPAEIWTIHGDGAFLKEHFSNSAVKVKNLAK